MNIIMDQQSSSKPNFFLKSPEISFAESPALSFLKGWDKNLMDSGNLNFRKKVSNGSIIKPSPIPSSIMPTPRYEGMNLLQLGGNNGLMDSKPMKSIKLEFLPLGSPEINFVLGPSAMDYQSKKVSKSIFDKHTQVAPEEKIQIKHIQIGGPNIYVTNKRVNRILKRRKKRVAFLLENPEYSLPYKFRTKGPRHQSRSKSAKNRKRKVDGRFARAGQGPIDFTVSIDDLDSDKDKKPEALDDIVRNKL